MNLLFNKNSNIPLSKKENIGKISPHKQLGTGASRLNILYFRFKIILVLVIKIVQM